MLEQMSEEEKLNSENKIKLAYGRLRDLVAEHLVAKGGAGKAASYHIRFLMEEMIYSKWPLRNVP